MIGRWINRLWSAWTAMPAWPAITAALIILSTLAAMSWAIHRAWMGP